MYDPKHTGNKTCHRCTRTKETCSLSRDADAEKVDKALGVQDFVKSERCNVCQKAGHPVCRAAPGLSFPGRKKHTAACVACIREGKIGSCSLVGRIPPKTPRPAAPGR